jgi:NAD(P)-dependent dehydrogenase (short-subunit alcohol dehydrogenase family)
MSQELAGKVAVITGGSSGIGFATANRGRLCLSRDAAKRISSSCHTNAVEAISARCRNFIFQ